MPSDKRARKRAARDAKVAALQRAQKRRSTIRRGIALVVIVAIAGGIYALVSGGSPAKPAAGKKPGTSTTTIAGSTTTTGATTTTTGATTTTVAASAAQTAADQAAVAAGCPSSPTAPLNKPTYKTAPAMTIDQSKTYTATVKTDVGTITIALDAKDAPKTVNSFVFLADHNFFNCEAFMRVIPTFMDQTGSPNQTNGGSNSGPGYTFVNENDSPAGGYTAGEVAMANSGANTNGSQFFILVGPYNNHGYSLFGHVTSGQSVVQAINNDGTSAGTPKVTHRMLSVTVSSS
jgi:cyclophilin family peptidyl-prolyl cis-trans isomerase